MQFTIQIIGSKYRIISDPAPSDSENPNTLHEKQKQLQRTIKTLEETYGLSNLDEKAKKIQKLTNLSNC